MVIRTIHTDLGRKGRKAIRSDLHTWGGGTPKLEVTWAQKSSLGREWLESHAGCPSRGDWPLGVLSVGLKTRGTKTSVVRNPDLSSEERAHTCLLPTRGRDSRLKLPANLAQLLWLPPSLLWLGPRVPVLDGGARPLGGRGPWGFCSSNSGDLAPSLAGWGWSPSGRNGLAHQWLVLAPHLRPQHPTKATAASGPQAKTRLLLAARPIHPAEATGHAQTI